MNGSRVSQPHKLGSPSTSPGTKSPDERRGLWPAWMLLLAGLLATAMFVISTKSVVDREAKQDFDFSCTEIRSKILDRLSAHEQILRSGAAFVEHSGLNRQEWHRFAALQRVEQKLPGILGLGYAVLIPRQRLEQHVQEIRAEGFPEYQVRPEGDREIYSSIICLEPFTNRNLRAFGYDMLSEPVRRAAMELARDQDNAILSGKVILVQETDTDIQAGTLMYMPVYQREMPKATVEQRRAALLGWVYSPYRMTDLMQGILGGWDLNSQRRIHLEIFDSEKMSSATLLYDNHPATNQLTRTASGLTSTRHIPATARIWTLRFTAIGLRTSGVGYAKVWLVLLGGTSTSLLFFGWFFSALNHRHRAQQMAAELRTELGWSEQRYSSLLNDMLDGFAYCRMVFDDHGNPTNFAYLQVNLAFERLTGLRNVVGKTVTEVIPNIGQSNPELFAICGRVVQTKESERFETYLTGLERWFAISVTSAGEGCFAAIFDDITARKQAEQALQTASQVSERLRQSLIAITGAADFDSALACMVQQAISLGGMDCGAVYVIDGQNAVLRQQVGMVAEFVEKVTCRPLSANYFKAALDSPREVIDVATRFPEHQRLAELYGLRHVYCIALMAEEKPFGFINVASCRSEPPDTTGLELIRILALEIESVFVRLGVEQRLRSVLSTMAEGVVLQGEDGSIIDCNRSAETILGLSRDQVLGRTSVDPLWRAVREDGSSFPGEEHPTMVSLKTGKPCEDVVMGLCLPDGTQKWININAEPMFNSGEDHPYAVVASFADITKRKLIEEALREGESRFHALLAQSVVGVAQVVTGTGRIVRANQRLCDMLGYTLEEIHEMTYMDFTHPEDLSSSLENMQRFASGNVKQVGLEKRYLRKDRSILWGNLTMLPLWKEGGKHDFHFSLVEDITEKRQLAERLRQSQKMEGIGQLAAGMAHEFNNILAAMGLNLNLVKKHSQNDEDGDLLGEIEGLSKRAADVIKQLMAFSRQSAMRVQPMDLATVVSRQCNLLGRLLGESITVEFSCPDRLPWVNADKGMIEQVLLNLCLNARDAMKNAGQIRLQLEETEVGAEKATAHDGVLPGNYVCLTVTDTGCGMDAGTLKRLFEPFFTTKEIGQGTGLGLATVQGIIQQHHGWVEVQSCLGVGSTFQIYLPAVAQPVIAPPSPEQKTLVRGTGMILVVEDEPILRKATRMLFVRMGYSVLEAANGKEALNLWEKHQAEIDLIYTDMVMPGDVTGLQIVQKGLADKPGVKAIITSGYHADQVDLSLLADLSIAYLPKPCTAATLTAVVQKCLQRG